MTIINSNYEEWHRENPSKAWTEFQYNPAKMSSSGGLYDLEKLNNISKDVISHMSAHELYEKTYEWSKGHSETLRKLIEKDPSYYESILNIEREQEKPRKDIAYYKMIEDLIWYMYSDVFEIRHRDYEWKNITNMVEIKNILNTYVDKYYSDDDDKETWFNKVKELCELFGYASNIKEYKKNPGDFKGSVADISTIIRVAVTTKSNTPDLYEIMKLLGKEEIIKRINML